MAASTTSQPQAAATFTKLTSSTAMDNRFRNKCGNQCQNGVYISNRDYYEHGQCCYADDLATTTRSTLTAPADQPVFESLDEDCYRVDWPLPVACSTHSDAMHSSTTTTTSTSFSSSTKPASMNSPNYNHDHYRLNVDHHRNGHHQSPNKIIDYHNSPDSSLSLYRCLLSYSAYSSSFSYLFNSSPSSSSSPSPSSCLLPRRSSSPSCSPISFSRHHLNPTSKTNLLLFIGLLILTICNRVPIVSSSKPPFTGANSHHGVGQSSPLNSSPLASLSSSSHSRRSEPETKPTVFFAPLESLESDPHDVMKCLYYNRTQCNNTGKGCGDTYQLCHPNEKPSLCFALWHNMTDVGVVVELKGCWFGSRKDCMSDTFDMSQPNNNNHHLKQCVATQSNKPGLHFCCCDGNICNKDMIHILSETKPTTATQFPAQDPLNGNSSGYRLPGVTFYLLLGLGIFFLVCVVSGIVFVSGKCRIKPNHGDVPISEPLLDSNNINGITGFVGIKPIQLKEIRAHGKFGSVWQATDGLDNLLAVKVFAVQDRSSWQIEKDVFCLPQMKHNNILSYLGAERHGEGLGVSFWLITEYHPNGSLWDFLKAQTVNWKQLLTIIQGIGRGLTHLHEEFPPSATEGAKPSIAHRDFKSKNVLLGTNFRACIADFGLALVFHQNSTCGDAHGQVGTRRYMAPEVLEGAINFNRDSFLRIDMYACGLVLWELMSRCNFGDVTCGEYRLPFEEEVGLHPSLEDMQEVVAQNKKRPKILDSWIKHPGMSVIASTVQDCWDQDAEARISASTICERTQSLILNEDNCLSLNNYNHNSASSANYRVAFTAGNNGSTTASAAITNNHSAANHTVPNNSHAPNGVVPNGISTVVVSNPTSTNYSKNSFLMTSPNSNGFIPNVNTSNNSHGPSNGTAFILRETAT